MPSANSRIFAMPRPPSPALRRRLCLGLAFVLATLVGCSGDAVSGPGQEPDLLKELLVPPTNAEIAAVRADWASRDDGARGYRVESTTRLDAGRQAFDVRAVSHLSPAPDGGTIRHYGAVAVPVGAAPGSKAVLVWGHGGDGGVDAGNALQTLAAIFGDDLAGFVVVMPSYRSESLKIGARTYTSTGEASPWNYDVDDALALLAAAVQNTAAIDPDRIGVLGGSRSGNVALQLGIREPRVDRVVDFYGPTNFFGTSAAFILDELLTKVEPDVLELAGVPALNEEIIQPLLAEAITVDEARLRLLVRSPLFFAADLPNTQAHHGTDDEVVPVVETERLVARMNELGRSETTNPSFQAFLYPGGEHGVDTLPGAPERARAFLLPLLSTD